MAFEKYSTEQLKKYQKTLLLSGIVVLILMCVMLGIGLSQISNDEKSSIVFLVPIIGPLAILPTIFSASIGKEIKNREERNSS